MRPYYKQLSRHLGRGPGAMTVPAKTALAPSLAAGTLFTREYLGPGSTNRTGTYCDVSPIARKTFQLPSGSFFITPRTVPRISSSRHPVSHIRSREGTPLDCPAAPSRRSSPWFPDVAQHLEVLISRLAFVACSDSLLADSAWPPPRRTASSSIDRSAQRISRQRGVNVLLLELLDGRPVRSPAWLGSSRRGGS